MFKDAWIRQNMFEISCGQKLLSTEHGYTFRSLGINYSNKRQLLETMGDFFQYLYEKLSAT